jgi:cell division protein FtsW (lipid II flippase)
MNSARGNQSLTALLVVAALAFIGLAVFYATTKTSLLASTEAVHYKHAIVSAGVAVLCLIGANMARRR